MRHRRAVIALDAHHDAARYCGRRNHAIGMPAAILATVVGSTVFVTLEKEVQLLVRIAVGLLSIPAAVLSGLQTFRADSEKAEKSRVTVARCGAIARDLEHLLALPSNERTTNWETLASLGKRFNAVAEAAPSLRDPLWAEAKNCHRKEF